MNERPKFCRKCGTSLISEKIDRISFDTSTGKRYNDGIEYLRCPKRTFFIWSWGHSEFYNTGDGMWNEYYNTGD